MEALSKLFPNLNKVFLESTIIAMFNKCENREEFKQVLRDLLVTMKEFAENNDELYAEELEVSLRVCRGASDMEHAFVCRRR